MDRLEKKIREGRGNFSDLYDLAKRSGKEMAAEITRGLQAEFPQGNIPEADVRRIVSPVLKRNHALITELAALVIETAYKEAGIGLKAIIPEYNIYRETELVREIAERSCQDEFY